MMAGCGRQIEKPDPAKGWEQGSLLLVKEAWEEFDAAGEKGVGNPREVALGEAVMLLTLQPKVQSNLDEAETHLRRLIEEKPDDDPGIFAAYFLARLKQVHDFNPNLDEALKLYEGLIDRHGGHPVAQAAVAKIIILRYFSKPAPERAAVLEEAENYRRLLANPDALRAFHGVMGDLALRLDGQRQRAIDHYLRAYELQIPNSESRATVVLRIARLAEAEGQIDLARQFYQKFVAEFERDTRNYWVRQHLKSMEKTP
jgi:tetratricopeptide (TPR) repeat protein